MVAGVFEKILLYQYVSMVFGNISLLSKLLNAMIKLQQLKIENIKNVYFSKIGITAIHNLQFADAEPLKRCRIDGSRQAEYEKRPKCRRNVGRAGVVKLVDTRDLGSRDASRGGSSPSARTIYKIIEIAIQTGRSIKCRLQKHFRKN